MGSIPFECTLSLFKYLFSYKSQSLVQEKEVIVSPMRLSKIYSKSKHLKVRLFCKNIVLFTVALDIIVTSELHFLYYGITPSMDSIQTILIVMVILFTAKAIYTNLNDGSKTTNWLVWLFKSF